jgi:hypothetical protein
VPLTESLFVLLAVGGVVCLERFLQSGRPVTLLGAAVLYLGASMVRYEGWVLLAVFFVFACARPAEGIKRACSAAIAALPFVFPVVWSMWQRGMTGNPFGYLDNVRTDSHGSGDLFAALKTPGSWLIAAQFFAAIAVTSLAICKLLSKRLRFSDLLWEIHAGAALLWIFWALATDNVPSQYPPRLIYPAIVFSSLPLAGAVIQRVKPAYAFRSIVYSAFFLGVFSSAYVLGLPAGYHQPSYAAASLVRSLYDRQILAPNDHVLVDHNLPQSTAVVVYANKSDLVHINTMGPSCPADLFKCAQPRRSKWSDKVRLAVIWDMSKAPYLAKLGWFPVARTDTWTLFLRPSGAASLGTCTK